MTTSELKIRLLLMHGRDKRLTLISFGLTTIFALAIIWIVFSLGRNYLGEAINGMFGPGAPFYYKLIIPGLILVAIISLFVKIQKIQNRPRTINKLIEKIENGAVAVSIIEIVKYKLTIPLGKIELKLFPIDYISFGLSENPGYRYSLPVHSNFVTELKTLMSGGDAEAIASSRQALYSTNDDAAYESSPQTPIKTIEEFKEFIKSELTSDIEQTETARTSIKTPKMIYIGIVVIIVVSVFVYMFTNSEGGFSIKSMLPIMIPIIVAYIVIFLFMRPKIAKGVKLAIYSGDAANNFKMKVLSKIVKFTSADAQYAMHGHAGLDDFMQSGLFTDKEYLITGNDLIIGRHSGVPYQLCDLAATYKRNFTDVKAAPDTVFYGQFFVARFNKSFSSSLFITPNPKNTKNRGNYYQIDSYLNTIDRGEKVMLEDPEFMNMFEVYAGDQIEARYILTPSMMERIKSLYQRMGGQLYISFKDNRITICSHSSLDNFELSMSSSLTDNDYQVIERFYTQLTSQLSIIDDLKLNIKIWR